MKVGRNEPCPCGSGQKYKKCCFEKDAEAEAVAARQASAAAAAAAESSKRAEPPGGRADDRRQAAPRMDQGRASRAPATMRRRAV